LAVQLPEDANWFSGGSSSVPVSTASSISGPYTLSAYDELQFEVDGDPLAPEPGVIPLAGLGLALLASAKLRYVRGCRWRNQSPRLP
jgi:hypothetical protein